MAWLAPITIGPSALLTGIVFTAIGNAGGDEPGDMGPNFRPAGIAMLIGGALLTAIGIYLATSNPGSTQNGTGTQWSIGAPTMSAPGAMQ